VASETSAASVTKAGLLVGRQDLAALLGVAGRDRGVAAVLGVGLGDHVTAGLEIVARAATGAAVGVAGHAGVGLGAVAGGLRAHVLLAHVGGHEAGIAVLRGWGTGGEAVEV